MKTISRLLDQINKYVLAIILMLLALLVFSNVLFRFVFYFPLHWSEEISTLLLVWMVFIGAAELQRKDRNLAVELVYSRLPARMKEIVYIIGQFLTLLALGVLMVASIQLVKFQSASMTLHLGWPVSIFGAAILVGSVLMFVYTLINTAKRIRAFFGGLGHFPNTGKRQQ